MKNMIQEASKRERTLERGGHSPSSDSSARSRVGLLCRSSSQCWEGGNEVLVKASLPVPFVSFGVCVVVASPRNGMQQAGNVLQRNEFRAGARFRYVR